MEFVVFRSHYDVWSPSHFNTSCVRGCELFCCCYRRQAASLEEGVLCGLGSTVCAVIATLDNNRRQQSICVTYGTRKSVRLYLKVRQARSSHKGKPCDSRVSVSFPASRAFLTCKRCRSSQHSETRQSNAPLITMLWGSLSWTPVQSPIYLPFNVKNCCMLMHLYWSLLAYNLRANLPRISSQLDLLTSFFLAPTLQPTGY